MSNVFANGMEIACQKGGGKVIAAFPDVCMSPPSPPAGPIPVPYPDTSKSSDMKEGSKNVKIKNGPVMLASDSFYKTSPLGNEAATNSFGASVLSHKITGKTFFAAYSLDVKFEGKSVPRHIDVTMSNCGSAPGTPGANTSTMSPPDPTTLDPPGTCTEEEYAPLNAEVGAAKAECGALKARFGAGGCKEDDPPGVKQEKQNAWKRQALARNHRDGKCFGGGDEGHQAQAAACWDHVSRCV